QGAGHQPRQSDHEGAEVQPGPGGEARLRTTRPRTAVRLARARLADDLEFVRRRLADRDWTAVARIALALGVEAGSVFRAGLDYPRALLGADLPPDPPPAPGR